MVEGLKNAALEKQSTVVEAHAKIEEREDADLLRPRQPLYPQNASAAMPQIPVGVAYPGDHGGRKFSGGGLGNRATSEKRAGTHGGRGSGRPSRGFGRTGAGGGGGRGKGGGRGNGQMRRLQDDGHIPARLSDIVEQQRQVRRPCYSAPLPPSPPHKHTSEHLFKTPTCTSSASVLPCMPHGCHIPHDQAAMCRKITCARITASSSLSPASRLGPSPPSLQLALLAP